MSVPSGSTISTRPTPIARSIDEEDAQNVLISKISSTLNFAA